MALGCGSWRQAVDRKVTGSHFMPKKPLDGWENWGLVHRLRYKEGHGLPRTPMLGGRDLPNSAVGVCWGGQRQQGSLSSPGPCGHARPLLATPATSDAQSLGAASGTASSGAAGPAWAMNPGVDEHGALESEPLCLSWTLLAESCYVARQAAVAGRPEIGDSRSS